MGEYFKPLNLTRKEWIHPHYCGDGLKWGEWTYHNSPTRRIMREIWSPGDVIVVVSDYETRVRINLEFEGGRETRPRDYPAAPPQTPYYDDLEDSPEWKLVGPQDYPENR